MKKNISLLVFFSTLLLADSKQHSVGLGIHIYTPYIESVWHKPSLWDRSSWNNSYFSLQYRFLYSKNLSLSFSLPSTTSINQYCGWGYWGGSCSSSSPVDIRYQNPSLSFLYQTDYNISFSQYAGLGMSYVQLTGKKNTSYNRLDTNNTAIIIEDILSDYNPIAPILHVGLLYRINKHIHFDVSCSSTLFYFSGESTSYDEDYYSTYTYKIKTPSSISFHIHYIWH